MKVISSTLSVNERVVDRMRTLHADLQKAQAMLRTQRNKVEVEPGSTMKAEMTQDAIKNISKALSILATMSAKLSSCPGTVELSDEEVAALAYGIEVEVTSGIEGKKVPG